MKKFLFALILGLSTTSLMAQWEIELTYRGYMAGAFDRTHTITLCMMKIDEQTSYFSSFALESGDDLYRKGESLILCPLLKDTIIDIAKVTSIDFSFHRENNWKTYSYRRNKTDEENSLHCYYSNKWKETPYLAPNNRNKENFWNDFKGSSELKISIKEFNVDKYHIYNYFFDMNGSTKAYNIVTNNN